MYIVVLINKTQHKKEKKNQILKRKDLNFIQQLKIKSINLT